MTSRPFRRQRGGYASPTSSLARTLIFCGRLARAGMPKDCADRSKKKAAICGFRWTRTNQRNSWARIPNAGARSAKRNDMRAMRNARSALATPGGIEDERSDIFPPLLELHVVVADTSLSFNFHPTSTREGDLSPTRWWRSRSLMTGGWKSCARRRYLQRGQVLAARWQPLSLDR